MQPLYKKTSTGTIQKWEIFVDNTTIIIRWGQIDGKIQETRDEIKEGKNIGRSNETTPEEQATLEAEALYLKQKKKGYVESIEMATLEEVDSAIIQGGIPPMLAHKYKECLKRITFPAYCQPKLDGHRCIAVIENGSASLWSRTRKPITSVPHIIDELNEKFKNNNNTIILDGELYVNPDTANFEVLTSYLRRQDPSPETKIVEYHVYDLASSKGSFAERIKELKILLDGGLTKVINVETTLVNSEEEFLSTYQTFMDCGYEGAMYRSSSGKYENKRSYGLLKLKEFQDAEYTITRIEEGKGKLAGHAIFVCGNFKCKLKGNQNKLKEYWEHPELVIGKKLTVRYQNLSSEGIPRFPVGIRLWEGL
jgi:DNA ligase 1